MEFDWKNISSDINKLYFDIGTSWYAPYSQNWLTKNSNCMVIGIEPNPININLLKNKENVAVKDLHKLEYKYFLNNRFKLLECAINNVNEPTFSDFYTFEPTNNKISGQNCSSLYKFKQKFCDNYNLTLDKIQVPVYPLKYFLEQVPYDRFPYISYIKIDTQGADLDVIKSAGNLINERVVYITAETDGECYEGSDCTRSNLNKYMNSQNFIKVNHANTKDPTFLNKNFMHLKDEYIFQKY